MLPALAWRNSSSTSGAHLALPPERLECRILAAHVCQEAVVPAVADILAVVGAEDREEAAGKMLPVHGEPLELLPREQQADHIALAGGDPLEVEEYLSRRGIPADDLAATVRQDDRTEAQLVHDAPNRRRNGFGGGCRVLRRFGVERARAAAGRKRVQVFALVPAKTQRAGDRVQHGRRGLNIPPLLQPRIPCRAHAGQLRDLLAAQAGRPAPGAGGKSGLFRLQRAALRPEEGG